MGLRVGAISVLQDYQRVQRLRLCVGFAHFLVTLLSALDAGEAIWVDLELLAFLAIAFGRPLPVVKIANRFF